MCVVSMVIQGATEQWPKPNLMNLQTAIDFNDIINRLAAIDAKLGARDCIDAKKEEYIAALEARIAELLPKKKSKKRKKQ